MGNERADVLAKNAAELSSTTSNTVSFSDAITKLNKDIVEKWSMSWAQMLHQKLHKHKRHTRKYESIINRRHQVAVTRALIGHSKITHSYLMDSATHSQPPRCTTCQQDLTINHLLFHCQHFNNQRRTSQLEGEENNSNKTDTAFVMKLNEFLIFTELINKL